MKQLLLITAATLALSACSDSSQPASYSDQRATAPAGGTSGRTIRIVGSSTVFPFTTAVAESFGARTAFATPVVESTGTGGGMRLFCGGVGFEHPDVSSASRRMLASEYAMCQGNGVTQITEIPIGYDGIVMTNTMEAQDMDLTLAQLWLALAPQTPADETCSSFIPNPHRTWSDIDSSLPDLRIEVFGPPPTSGTRDSWVELALAAGAEQIPCMAELSRTDPARFRTLAEAIREDGAWIDAGENDNTIVQTLLNTPTAFGVFGYSYLAQNANRLQAVAFDGVEPSFESIASGEYPISRSMYVYIKNQHVGVASGLAEFAAEYVSEDAMGEFGYLADRGLIPLPEARRAEVAEHALALTPMTEAPQ